MVAMRLDVQGVQDTIALLRKVEPEGLKELRREIKNDSGVTEALSSIRSEIPTVAPLSGMVEHEGKTRYLTPRVSVSLRTPRRTMAQSESSLITLVAASPKGSFGFELSDMAGRASGGRNARGRALLRNLARKASRFVYPGFEKKQQNVADGVKRILDKYASRVNVKLRVM
jgi:hypothetical protein